MIDEREALQALSNFLRELGRPVAPPLVPGGEPTSARPAWLDVPARPTEQCVLRHIPCYYFELSQPWDGIEGYWLADGCVHPQRRPRGSGPDPLSLIGR